MTRLSRFLWVVLVGASSACSPPEKDARETFRTPDEAAFARVSAVLEARCGSLDCHGQMGRSLRIFGRNGLRASRDDVSGADAGVPTRPEEELANYASVVALEPEILDRVVVEGGKSPERLTLVRKARGSEHHKGGRAWEEGGAADRCFVSWLRGKVDTAACEQGKELGFLPWP
ncbi:MAG: hypothetical protein U0263_39385 [Polyangiaceae bacterium]